MPTAETSPPGRARLVSARHVLLLRAVLAMASALWLREILMQTPWPAWVAALGLGAAGLTALALWARTLALPREIAEAGLLHGTLVAAAVAATLNELGVRGLGLLTGARGGVGAEAAALAALIEEVVKLGALALLLAARPAAPTAAAATDRQNDPSREAGRRIVLGAAVGIGFAASENLVYLTFALIQGGTLGLWKGLYLRGLLGGLAHAVFTGTAAVGLQPSPARAPRGAPAAHLPWLAMALGAAVAQHLIWNLVPAPIIADQLCAAPSGGGACVDVPPTLVLVAAAPALALLCLGPGAAWLLRRLARAVPAVSDPPHEPTLPR